jgi:hypothetical protein
VQDEKSRHTASRLLKNRILRGILSMRAAGWRNLGSLMRVACAMLASVSLTFNAPDEFMRAAAWALAGIPPIYPQPIFIEIWARCAAAKPL